MQLPHTVLVVEPAEMADEYGNPVPRLDYQRGTRRPAPALMQPLTSQEQDEPGRHTVASRWRLFTFAEIPPRARVEWRGRVYEIEGEPQVWTPRPGHRHVEAVLKVVGSEHGTSSAV